MTHKAHQFIALDGLRGFAALAVVVCHFSMGMTVAGDMDSSLLPGAYLAVDFFMLSGFVIAHAYEQRLLGALRFFEFMKIRLIRLYPLYFLAIALPIIVITGQSFLHLPHDNYLHNVIPSYLLHLLLLPTPPIFSPIDSNVFPLDGPTWSLSVEMGINVIYALCCPFLSLRRLIMVSVLSAFCLGAVSYHYVDLNTGWEWHGYIGGWARVMWNFPIGIVLYRFLQRERERERERE